jgi:NhaA family Na+:H+ antiporter
MGFGRDRIEALVGAALTPFERFLGRTTAGSIVLLAATVLALVMASLVGPAELHHFWDEPFVVGGAGTPLSMNRHHWVNDGLMALFFLMVGLELKRELLVGELASLRDAALPIFAAVGGMVAPAALYVAFNHGTGAIAGWGIPMATDIAFAVGILVMLSSRVPRNLIVFLTALAIADDLGAVLVIAIFYTGSLDWASLARAGGLVATLALLNVGGVRHPLPYTVIGLLLWIQVLTSGLHATLAGVVLAACIPVRAAQRPRDFAECVDLLRNRWREDLADASTAEDPLRNAKLASLAMAFEGAAVRVQSPLQRIEHALTPWIAFGVVPLFALANAGIDLRSVDWSRALHAHVTLGVAAGLVIGKFAGITLASWIAVRLGLARLPSGVAWRHLLGAAWLGGIGFTMSLFIAQLAFQDERLVEEARLGILLASFAAAVIGVAWLYFAGRGAGASTAVGDGAR